MLFIITKILSMNQESGRRASDKSRNDKLWIKVQQFTAGTPSGAVWAENEFQER